MNELEPILTKEEQKSNTEKQNEENDNNILNLTKKIEKIEILEQNDEKIVVQNIEGLKKEIELFINHLKQLK